MEWFKEKEEGTGAGLTQYLILLSLLGHDQETPKSEKKSKVQKKLYDFEFGQKYQLILSTIQLIIPTYGLIEQL